jgi:hypothetical protein
MASARRLEDRIRELAACLATAPEYDLYTIMLALQAAMEEYMRRFENKAETVLAWPEFQQERRGT